LAAQLGEYSVAGFAEAERLADPVVEVTLFAVLPAVLVGLALMLVRLLRRRRERRGFEVRAKDVTARVEA
jgi:hypothetical protein